MVLHWLMMICSLLMEILVKSHFWDNEMGVLGVDLDKINLEDDNNFHENDPKTNTLIS